MACHLRDAGYQVITTSNKRNKIMRLLDMLTTIWRKRRDYRVAQINVFSGKAFMWAYLSAKLLKKLKKTFILTLHGGNLPQFSLHHQKNVRWLLNHASKVTVPSRYLQEAMRLYRNDLILIPNALDIHLYPYKKRVSPRPIIVWLRAFHEIYNPELAIRVLDSLRKDYPEARLIMVGPDKGDGSLQRTRHLVNQLRLERSVEFAGGVPKVEVPLWLNKGDIFLNTTNYDNAPISVIEAMACGLCVVSTNVGGIPYLLQNNEDALLVSQNHPAEMKQAVARILAGRDLAMKISQKARSQAEQYDWSMILPKWNKILNQVIE
jgi:glycosyltransferase involved in cell wall biosynthesis